MHWQIVRMYVITVAHILAVVLSVKIMIYSLLKTNGGTMRQLIIKANGCHDCSIFSRFNSMTGKSYCEYLQKDNTDNCDDETFHKDCPMVEVKENIDN